MPDGRTEVVHTFGWYMRKMIADTRQKGATPILFSLTVRNIWTDGHVERGSADIREGHREKQPLIASKLAPRLGFGAFLRREVSAGPFQARLQINRVGIMYGDADHRINRRLPGPPLERARGIGVARLPAIGDALR